MSEPSRSKAKAKPARRQQDGGKAVGYAGGPQKYLSPAIELTPLAAGFARADLEFHGVDHSGASFEARIFFNNPGATAATEKTPANGYAGAFHIFGHGGCYGDLGHCEVKGLPRAF